MKIIGEPEIPQPVHKQTVDKQIVIDTNQFMDSAWVKMILAIAVCSS